MGILTYWPDESQQAKFSVHQAFQLNRNFKPTSKLEIKWRFEYF